MKQLILTTISSLLLGVFVLTCYTSNLINPVSGRVLTDSAGIAAPAEKNPDRSSVLEDFKSPGAAAKAFIVAWRNKNRAAMLKVAEKDVVNGIGNLIKGSTFRGCKVDTESAQKAYNCTVQAGNDNLTAVYLEVVLTRLGYRIMSIDYAAAH